MRLAQAPDRLLRLAQSLGGRHLLAHLELGALELAAQARTTRLRLPQRLERRCLFAHLELRHLEVAAEPRARILRVAQLLFEPQRRNLLLKRYESWR